MIGEKILPGIGFPVGDLLVVMAASAVAVVLLMLAVAFLARRLGRVSVVDVAWSLGFVLVALLSSVLGPFLRRDREYHLLGAGDVTNAQVSQAFDSLRDQSSLRTWLLFALVLVWGGRLALHIARRSRGAGEDPRYEELMARGPGGIVRKVLLPQGVAIWFVSLPLQVASVSLGRIGLLTYLGALVWAVGLAFESIGDAQLTAYKARPDRPRVMETGLWRYTRHPNYFGDACVWWGLFLVAADVWPGVLTILSPVAMTFFLVFATGARLLERTMMQRPGYPEYAARTSMFLPLPPRRVNATSPARHRP